MMPLAAISALPQRVIKPSEEALASSPPLLTTMPPRFGNTAPEASVDGQSQPSVWGKLVTLAQDYGPYAIIGGFFSAIGLAGYAFTDNYLDWLKESQFPIEKWPNTGKAILAQHHAGHCDDHAGDGATTTTKQHVHPDGSVCKDPVNCKPALSQKPPGIMDHFQDPAMPTIQDRIQNDTIARQGNQLKELQAAIEKLTPQAPTEPATP